MTCFIFEKYKCFKIQVRACACVKLLQTNATVVFESDQQGTLKITLASNTNNNNKMAEDLVTRSIDHQLDSWFPFSIVQPFLQAGANAFHYLTRQKQKLDKYEEKKKKEEKEQQKIYDRPTTPKTEQDDVLQEMLMAPLEGEAF